MRDPLGRISIENFYHPHVLMLARDWQRPGYPPGISMIGRDSQFIGTEALGRVRSGAEKGRQIARCIDSSLNLHPLPRVPIGNQIRR
jgi:hypothetical protein